jgi:tetratricopeptide (TPR) repeat protein
VAVSLQLLAHIGYSEGHNIEARDRAGRALEIVQEIGDRQGEAAALHLLAQIDHAEGRYAEARERAGQVLKIEQEVGERQGEAAALSLLGAVAANLGKPKEAFDLMTLSTLILTQIGHAEAREATNILGALVVELKFTKEQQQELLQSVQAAYRKDGGKELISYALAKLREEKD